MKGVFIPGLKKPETCEECVMSFISQFETGCICGSTQKYVYPKTIDRDCPLQYLEFNGPLIEQIRAITNIQRIQENPTYAKQTDEYFQGLIDAEYAVRTQSLVLDMTEYEMKKPEVIDSFIGQYEFLSNFYPCTILYNGLMFNSSEAAYQSQKCPYRAIEFCSLSPMQAKKLGRKVVIREDWDRSRLVVMNQVVRLKFKQNPNLAELLIQTGDAELIEGNYWHDTFWGICNGVGQNCLGRILMKVREELKNDQNK